MTWVIQNWAGVILGVAAAPVLALWWWITLRILWKWVRDDWAG